VVTPSATGQSVDLAAADAAAMAAINNTSAESVDPTLEPADARGNVIHDDTFRLSYRRVIGHVLVGRGPGDPPEGAIEEPGKPPGA
jgi:hypothetical protein